MGVCVFGISFAQNNFPLLRQTWVFTNGPTEKTHIVKSITNFAPSKVFVCHFSSQNRDILTGSCRFASLEGLYLRSTAEALDSVYAQLRRNFLTGEIARAYYNAFPDTFYSCASQLRNLASRGVGRFRSFSINGQSVEPSAITDEWFSEPPTCYASRQRMAGDDIDEMACENGWCASMFHTGFNEVCSATGSECRSYIEESDLSTRSTNRYYWNLHLFPKVVLHPKHQSTGRVMTEISLTEAQAITLRDQAVANPSNETLKPYLNPVLDDSASVIFSGQFLTPENPQASFLSLDIPASSPGATSFTHDPKYVFRIPSMPDDNAMALNTTTDLGRALRAALLRPYAKSNRDDEFLQRLDSNCPFWATRDMEIGKQAFSIRPLTASLPDAIPSDPYDPSWKRQVTEGGMTYLRDNRTLENQLAIVRNIDFSYSDYWWKGCPDRERVLGLTKKQMLDFVSNSIPLCNLKEVAAANSRVYMPIYQTFANDGDKDEALTTSKRITQVEQISQRFQGQLNNYTYENCPTTELSVLVNR